MLDLAHSLDSGGLSRGSEKCVVLIQGAISHFLGGKLAPKLVYFVLRKSLALVKWPPGVLTI